MALEPYLWPAVAIGLAIWLGARAVANRTNQQRSLVRAILALLLVAFATDTLTGGDYRWFELAMRREMRKCGGPAALQNWAQRVLTSPQQVAAFEDHDIFGFGGSVFAPLAVLEFQQLVVEWRNDAWTNFRLLQQTKQQHKFIIELQHESSADYLLPGFGGRSTAIWPFLLEEAVV